MIILVDIECNDYSLIFDCRVFSFLNNRARESRFLQYAEAERIHLQQKRNRFQFCRNYSLRVDTGVRVRIFFKAVFTFGAQVLVTGHRHKMVLCSDTGYRIYQCPVQ